MSTHAGASRDAGFVRTARPGTRPNAGRRLATGGRGQPDPRRGPADDRLSLLPDRQQPVQHRRPGLDRGDHRRRRDVRDPHRRNRSVRRRGGRARRHPRHDGDREGWPADPDRNPDRRPRRCLYWIRQRRARHPDEAAAVHRHARHAERGQRAAVHRRRRERGVRPAGQLPAVRRGPDRPDPDADHLPDRDRRGRRPDPQADQAGTLFVRDRVKPGSRAAVGHPAEPLPDRHLHDPGRVGRIRRHDRRLAGSLRPAELRRRARAQRDRRLRDRRRQPVRRRRDDRRNDDRSIPHRGGHQRRGAAEHHAVLAAGDHRRDHLARGVVGPGPPPATVRGIRAVRATQDGRR